ncbi:MAG: organic hydroperoxide resistance protein [Mesorhizobium sp.]
MSAIYSTAATTRGGREGHVESADGIIALDLAIPSEMGGKGGATNPEQLFAAGYSACYGSALQFLAQRQNLPLQDAAVTATVGLATGQQGAMHLTASLDVVTTGLDQETAEALAQAAHKVCPYSNALRGNVDVTLNVRAQ